MPLIYLWWIHQQKVEATAHRHGPEYARQCHTTEHISVQVNDLVPLVQIPVAQSDVSRVGYCCCIQAARLGQQRRHAVSRLSGMCLHYPPETQCESSLHPTPRQPTAHSRFSRRPQLDCERQAKCTPETRKPRKLCLVVTDIRKFRYRSGWCWA